VGASWWELAQGSSLVDTGTKIPGTTTCQRGSSVHLSYARERFFGWGAKIG